MKKFSPDIDVLKQHLTSIEPQDSMAEAGRKILLRDFVQMLENEAGSRTGEDIENVHDMRVATRRMRSIFRLLADHYKARSVRPYISSMRGLAQVLGAVRDLDVMIWNLTKYQEALNRDDQTTLQTIIDRLDKRRKKARKKLIAYLDGEDYKKFVKDFDRFLNQPGKGAISFSKDSVSAYQVRHVLPVTIHEHLATVKAYDTVLADAKIETLHALRIEFKRLRYVVSTFKDVLGSSIDGFISELRVIQDHLGEMNDSRVAQESIHALIGDIRMDEQQLSLLEQYIHQLEAEEITQAESFGGLWDRFNTRAVQRKLSDALLVLR